MDIKGEIKVDGGTYIQNQLLNNDSLTESLISNGVEIEYVDPVTFQTTRRISNGKPGNEPDNNGHQ